MICPAFELFQAREIERRRVEFQPLSAEQVERQIVEGFKSAEPEVVKRPQAVIPGCNKES